MNAATLQHHLERRHSYHPRPPAQLAWRHDHIVLVVDALYLVVTHLATSLAINLSPRRSSPPRSPLGQCHQLPLFVFLLAGPSGGRCVGGRGQLPTWHESPGQSQAVDTKHQQATASWPSLGHRVLGRHIFGHRDHSCRSLFSCLRALLGAGALVGEANCQHGTSHLVNRKPSTRSVILVVVVLVATSLDYSLFSCMRALLRAGAWVVAQPQRKTRPNTW